MHGKRLLLNRESVRRLSIDELQDAAGGGRNTVNPCAQQSVVSLQTGIVSDDCPNLVFVSGLWIQKPRASG